jgi:ubiquinone/menaquinone biosynthesis C-methylase UbiE
MNPAYRDLIAHFQAFIAERVSPTARILDVGAGTGNFILSGAQIAPNARWTHLDADDAMNAIASEKYRRALLQVDMIQQRGELATFQPASFDIVVSINAMYAMPEPKRLLRKLAGWLAPGGLLYLVDLGRIQNTFDWTQFLVRQNTKRMGLRRTLSVLLNEGKVISSQNRRIAKLQRAGRYWKHSRSELDIALKQAGFTVELLETCYRGYSDRAIAHNQRQDVVHDLEARVDTDESIYPSLVGSARSHRGNEANFLG